MASFAGRLSAPRLLSDVLRAGMLAASSVVERRAKKNIGEYQPAIAGLAAWSPLAEVTKRERVRLGFSEDEPLLRTGGLRDSYHVDQNGMALEVGVGSDLEKALDMEIGVPGRRVPARSVLGIAFAQSEPVAFRAFVNVLRSLATQTPERVVFTAEAIRREYVESDSVAAGVDDV